jgi:chaperonin GroEL (HSP60 family)
VAGAAQGAVFKTIADALEVIPRTLVQNAGGNAIRVLTELRVRFPTVYLITLDLLTPHAAIG